MRMSCGVRIVKRAWPSIMTPFGSAVAVYDASGDLCGPGGGGSISICARIRSGYSRRAANTHPEYIVVESNLIVKSLALIVVARRGHWQARSLRKDNAFQQAH